ncbi:MAG: glucoamylase family protein [Bacteroidota bacterium]
MLTGIRKVLFCLLIYSVACTDKNTEVPSLSLVEATAGPVSLSLELEEDITENVPIDRSISLTFSAPVSTATTEEALSLKSTTEVDFDLSFSNENQTLILFPVGTLENGQEYTLQISSQLSGTLGETFAGTQLRFKTTLGDLELISVTAGGEEVPATGRTLDVLLNLSLTLNFSVPVSQSSVTEAVRLSGAPELEFNFSDENKTVNITSSNNLDYLTRYDLTVSDQLTGEQGEAFAGLSRTLYTSVDETPKFPVISDEELLTKVQQQTFRYFWDFGHPVSGMARERNTSGDLVTSGGTGFGLMTMIVGVERGFISRAEAVGRFTTVIDFLETADRFHGAWPHWMDGNTGKVIPFSPRDDGGDLVETAFLVQGLLTVRAWLDEASAEEKALIDKITQLWEEVEWSWYTQDGQDVLYWHWSPSFEWAINLPISGYNEALIVYVLAAGSPTFPISSKVYENGWARNGQMANGNSYYSQELPLGPELGGPLFFSHYSFLGLDPSNLSDQYANYWTQSVNHALISHAYCADNPKNFAAYSEECWGLTASDNQDGYSAHSPTNDLGVITPTAALSSFPYTPEKSLQALQFFYYKMGDRLWGEYGFYDAFNATEGWYADSYLAIDQGPIVIMIENYRSGLLWDLFMSVPEAQTGLNNLNFSY